MKNSGVKKRRNLYAIVLAVALVAVSLFTAGCSSAENMSEAALFARTETVFSQDEMKDELAAFMSDRTDRTPF